MEQTTDNILSFSEEEKNILQRYNIAIIGFMGAGKTTISKKLEELVGLKAVDTDALIVEKEGRTIAQIFSESGEPYFRRVETETVLSLQKERGLVISCGGGVAMREENVANLKKGSRIVLLRASAQTIYERVKDSTDRPLLNGHMNVEYISQLMEVRRPKYEAAADIAVATDGKKPQEICRDILQKLIAF